MSSKIRRKNSSVVGQLLDAPADVSFVQAVRLLDRAALLSNRKQAGKARDKSVGQFTPPQSESIRFQTQLTLGFPTGDIAHIEKILAEGGSYWKIAVYFMGLTGSSGVLPFHYTEMLFQRLKLKDEALKKFLDVFNHRTISLFYQASVKYRLPLAYERQKLSQQRRERLDQHTHAILSLLGLGTDHLVDQLNMHHESLAFYSGLLSLRPRPASAIRQMLNHYFDVPVKIEEFVGEWQDLIDDVRSRLPSRANPLGQNARLGRSAILGGKGWFAQGKIRVVLGPLNAEQFQRFAPGTDTLKRLNQAVKHFSGGEMDSEYVLQVSREQIPKRIQLRQDTPPIIGWNTWLASKPGPNREGRETLDIRVSAGRLN